MILIGNGRVITRDSQNTYIEKGAVLVEGERIREVGTDTLLKEKYPKAKYMDAEGMVVMPGLINTHEHIYSAYARGLAISGSPARNFLEILEKTWWHIDRRLTLENTYYSALATYLECIRNGVTFVSDHHAGFGAVEGSLFAIGRAAKELNMRTCLAYEISDREGEEKRDASIRENMEWIAYTKKQNDPMQSGLVGMHASFTLSEETLEKCQDANGYHAGYHIHVAEGAYDAWHCQKYYHMSVTERLQKHNILGRQTIAGHCIHIKEKDKDILKETDTMVVHNPESNMGNAVGAPDVIGMYDKGILVGLGTDGYTNDMLESVKVANILQKHRRKLPDRGFAEACGLLFRNNAKIVSRLIGEKIGVLETGALADLIFMDYHAMTELNAHNINGHIVFGMQGAMTDSVMINGKMVMRHKKMLLVEEEEILQKSRESANELWRRI